MRVGKDNGGWEGGMKKGREGGKEGTGGLAAVGVARSVCLLLL